MDRPLEVGDFVTIALGDQQQTYIVRDIAGLDIWISTQDQPQRLSRLYLLNGNYVIKGAETVPYLIVFSASNSGQSSDVLTGNVYLDIDILTLFDNQDLDKFCQINHPYVQELCSNDNLWINKIIQDFGQLSLSLKPSKVGLEEYYYDHVNFPTHLDLVQYNRWSSRGRGRQAVHGINRRRMFLSEEEPTEPKKIVEDYIEGVARKGEVHFLNALISQGFRPNVEYADLALEHGQLLILERLTELGVYPTDPGVINAILLSSDVRVFEWVKQNISISSDEPGRSYATSTNKLTWKQLANLAAARGHLLFLEWLEEKEGILPDEVGANNAVLNNRLEIVEWLKSKGVVSQLKFRRLPQTWEEALENIDLITSDKTVEDRYAQPELLRILNYLNPNSRVVRRSIKPGDLRKLILDHFKLPLDYFLSS